MIEAEDVRRFLAQFNAKVKIYGILFRDDRGKNQETLQILDITPLQRMYSGGYPFSVPVIPVHFLGVKTDYLLRS